MYLGVALPPAWQPPIGWIRGAGNVNKGIGRGLGCPVLLAAATFTPGGAYKKGMRPEPAQVNGMPAAKEQRNHPGHVLGII